MPEKTRWTKNDIIHVIFMVLTTLAFSRQPEIVQTLRQLLVCIFYGFGIVYLFIGLTKKMFKYNPTNVKIVKWAVSLAALVAVTQFLQDVYEKYRDVLSQQAG